MPYLFLPHYELKRDAVSAKVSLEKIEIGKTSIVKVIESWIKNDLVSSTVTCLVLFMRFSN